MNERLHLYQQHLYTFEACPRRFYLRYLAHVPWPEAPLGPDQALAYERGRRFHRWIERDFLGLLATDETHRDPLLQQWWSIYRANRPALPAGQRFVEASLTIPIGHDNRHTLSGRFDLVVVGDDVDGRPAATIYDWKTGDPRAIGRLRRAWQTRVYLAVLAEGGAALAPGNPEAFAPNRLSFIYWYVEDPDHPRVIRYDEASHRRNLAELEAVVAGIDEQLATGDWPLTDTLAECRLCAYQTYCGRQTAGDPLPVEADEDALEPAEDWLEPQWG